MGKIQKVTLENFRCFQKEQSVRLAPLTFLVGDNSTGKTSFLALIRALWDAAGLWSIPNFKELPYDLGSFDEISHYRGGRGGRASAFKAGFEAETKLRLIRGGSHAHSQNFEVTFTRDGSAPVPTKYVFGSKDASLTSRIENNLPKSITFKTKRGEWFWRDASTGDDGARYGDASLHRHFLYSGIIQNEFMNLVTDEVRPTKADQRALEALHFGFHVGFTAPPRPFASAPVRSKPRRTFDPSLPIQDPEGEGIPMYMASLFFEDESTWNSLKEELERFGRDAGLFDEISIRPLGKKSTEPFQLHVRKRSPRARGPFRNLVDVGYGVSQVLPMIVGIFRYEKTSMFLMQQPEVHLHPSAQAALGGYFSGVAAGGRQFVIETHSDYMIDRVRTDIRDGKTKLGHEDVSILFFERQNLDVKIHSVRLDERGNVLGAPDSYRKFFMQEAQRVLNF